MATSSSKLIAAVRRNIQRIRACAYGDKPVEFRSSIKSSPTRQSGSNHNPSQSHSRSAVDAAIDHELTKARFVAPDLADHIFGGEVSTALARDILQQLLVDGVVRVFDKQETGSLDPKSDGARLALQVAYDDAIESGCVRSFDKVKKYTEKNKYKWEWQDFLKGQTAEADMVRILNNIADKALDAAKNLDRDGTWKAKNRFAYPKDKHHAVPLSYEPGREDMRPDFMVLPIAAFSGDQLQNVDEAYVNFTMMRLVGEIKSKKFRDGLAQVQRYVRGIKRAQPWLRFSTGMTIAGPKVALVRGDGSGTERIEINLNDGWGCLEFVRILLGIVVADREHLGHNPNVELSEARIICNLNSLHETATPVPGNSSNAPSSTATGKASGSSRVTQVASASHPPDPTSSSTSAAPSTRKRSRNQADEAQDELGSSKDRQQTKGKGRAVELLAVSPSRIYGRESKGILFASGSIKGRSTTVCAVLDVKDQTKLLALKISWQDVTRIETQKNVLEKIRGCDAFPHIVVPFESLETGNGVQDTTLGSIRSFLVSEMRDLGVENRVLTVTLSELWRPVKYFWSVHDFVRGIRGALMGHEYLCQIGILHRDISENNIVLPVNPGHDGGALIDFEMAVACKPNIHLQAQAHAPKLDTGEIVEYSFRSPSPLSHGDGPRKAERTGTAPYMSINVLKGGDHTHQDDLESFLYVLILFFFSYKGPLSRVELATAQRRAFTHPIGSGQLPHVTAWPAMFNIWAQNNFQAAARDKGGLLLLDDGYKDLIANNHTEINARWAANPQSDTRLSFSIGTVLANCWRMFNLRKREPVTHQRFIDVLGRWLETYKDDEAEWSNCPFDAQNRLSF